MYILHCSVVISSIQNFWIHCNSSLVYVYITLFCCHLLQNFWIHCNSSLVYVYITLFCCHLLQNFWIHCNSSFFVFGSDLAIFLFIWFHTISIGLMSGLSEGQTVHQLISFSSINCFGSLSCWNLWESGNLSLMNGRRLPLKMLLVKNSFSIMLSNIVILEGSLLVIAAHTCTLRGCFGFGSPAGNERSSLYITVLFWCSCIELSSEKMMSSNVSLVSISIWQSSTRLTLLTSHQLAVARLGSSKSDCLYGAIGCWQTKLCTSSIQLVVYLSARCGRIFFDLLVC